MRSLILQEAEDVVRVFRQSPAVLAWPGFVVLFLATLPALYLLRYTLFGSFFIWWFLWFVLLCLWFTQKYVLWRREKYIVTTRRLVKTVHESVFRQVVTETTLDRILNISFRTTGPWSMLARFGDIDVQVVGRMEPIVVKSVRTPAQTKEFLWRLHERATANSPHAVASHARSYVGPNQVLDNEE